MKEFSITIVYGFYMETKLLHFYLFGRVNGVREEGKTGNKERMRERKEDAGEE